MKASRVSFSLMLCILKMLLIERKLNQQIFFPYVLLCFCVKGNLGYYSVLCVFCAQYSSFRQKKRGIVE